MDSGADDPTAIQWWDEASYQHLIRSDRSELDWAFACRHASRKQLPTPQVSSVIIREAPPFRLLSVESQSTWPGRWGLRFRPTRNRRKRRGFLARFL